MFANIFLFVQAKKKRERKKKLLILLNERREGDWSRAFEIKKVKKDVKTETPAINMEVKNVDPEDPDHIIARNIAKADAILDKLMHEMDDGNFSPRMVEVSGQIINAITNSTSLLYNKNFNLANIQLKIQQIKLKEKEIDLLAGRAIGGDTTNQNIIFTDRETILKYLKTKIRKSATKILQNLKLQKLPNYL